MIEPFHVDVPSEVIGDLRARLSATRWPAGVADSGGIPLSEMREIARYWRSEFDWRAQEHAINRVPHFRAVSGGLRLHYIHIKASRPGGMPLLLLHGWPGSFVEMLGLLPRLATSFDLIVPSLPGFGFSDPAVSAGMSNERIATMLAELMTALGYERFAVHGGDVGAGVATWLALRFPARVQGIHLNYIPGSYAPFVGKAPSDEEAAFLEQRLRWAEEHGAYGHAQRTRPLTLGYALSDSPSGLAGWIIEKFREWADPGSRVPLDTILTNVTVYWVTNSIASSIRLYLESARTPLRFHQGESVRVPCGIARFPHEAPFPPRPWVERGYDVTHWTDMPRGGHFAALEEPELLANDIVTFLRTLR
jgi:pimeloyl-ACP methyl ester carboxylesterase